MGGRCCTLLKDNLRIVSLNHLKWFHMEIQKCHILHDTDAYLKKWIAAVCNPFHANQILLQIHLCCNSHTVETDQEKRLEMFVCVATAVIACRQLLLKMLIFMQNILLVASLFQPVPKITGFRSIVPQRWASLFVLPVQAQYACCWKAKIFRSQTDQC